MAVFIDLENLFSGYSGTVHGVPITKIMNGIKAEVQALAHKRSAATTRAYANWTYRGMATYRRETIENGVEPIQVWSSEPYEKKGKTRLRLRLMLMMTAITRGRTVRKMPLTSN